MTKYPHDDWLIGKIVLLRSPEDFLPGQEQNVCAAVNATARRNDWNVICRTGMSPESGRHVVVWGDKNLSRTDPVPKPILDGLVDAGYRPPPNK